MGCTELLAATWEQLLAETRHYPLPSLVTLVPYAEGLGPLSVSTVNSIPTTEMAFRSTW